MGIFDFLKKTSVTKSITLKSTQKLSYVDKERIMVERVTTSDMLQFTMLPYDLNCPVHKFIPEGGHPFAYMNLNKTNQTVAREELAKINEHILRAQNRIPSLTPDTFLQIDKIVFKKYSPYHGYTRLICTPYTFTGKIAKYPLSLSFMTKLESCPYEATGDLFYGKDGNIQKATVNIMYTMNDRKGSWVIWQFTFKVVEQVLVISQAKTNLEPDEHGLAGIVYQLAD